MALVDDLADALAHDVFALIKRTDNELLVMEFAKVIGASSQTLEEAYLTSIRLLIAEERARNYYNGLKAKLDAQDAAKAKADAQGGAA